jgi:superfamily II DNA or RNA helicase
MATMEQRVTVKIRGSWLLIENIPDQIYPQFTSALSYDKTVYDYTANFRGGSISASRVRVACYKSLHKDNQPKAILARAGFLTRVTSLLEKNNVPFDVQDLSTNIGKYFVNLDALEGYELRDQQADCLKQILLNRGGIIKAATGYGKTFLIPLICKVFSEATIHIVTKRKDVARGIVRECTSHDVKVGLITSGQPTAPGRILVCTAGSLDRTKYDADLVILDECHELVTPHYLEKLMRYKNARFYGFSATAEERADNAHFHLEQLCGPVIYRAEYKEVCKEGNIVPIVIQWIRVPAVGGIPASSQMPFHYLRKALRNHVQRNKTIVDVARKYKDSGNQVLIITKTVEHALLLARDLPEFELCCGTLTDKHLRTAQRYQMDLSKLRQNIKNRNELALAFRNRSIMGAIATEIWTTGVSFDDLEVLIRADADTSKISTAQVPGRVCRLPQKTDKAFGLVVDFIDEFHTQLYARSLARYRAYKKMGWTQCDENLQPISSFPRIYTKI